MIGARLTRIMARSARLDGKKRDENLSFQPLACQIQTGGEPHLEEEQSLERLQVIPSVETIAQMRSRKSSSWLAPAPPDSLEATRNIV